MIVRMVNEDYYKRRCPAMIKAGIKDPDSIAGALFCAGDRHGLIESQCPYPYCVVFESSDANTLRAEERERVAKALRSHEVSVEDIALILGRHAATIRKYLRRK